MNRFRLLGGLAVAAFMIPSLAQDALKSGLEIGKYTPPFNPTHVVGPDKGTTACPP